ncbi:hypothetical protein D9M71_398780 [compost metagenome]
MRRKAEALAERTNQVGTRQAAGRANVFQAQRVAAMGTYERCRRFQSWAALIADAGVTTQNPRQLTEQRRQAAFPIRHAGIEQVGKGLQQAPVQRRRSAPDLGRQGKPQRLQPGQVDEQHQVGPRLPCNGVAGMHHTRVHQHRGASTHLDALVTVQVGAASTGNHPDGKALVGMRGVAHLAPVPYPPGFDERQRRVAPEP